MKFGLSIMLNCCYDRLVFSVSQHQMHSKYVKYICVNRHNLADEYVFVFQAHIVLKCVVEDTFGLCIMLLWKLAYT